MSKTPFARWLEIELKRRDWRQRQLAEASGVSQQTASRWLSGRSTPAGIHLRSLAVAFDVSADEILELCDQEHLENDEPPCSDPRSEVSPLGHADQLGNKLGAA